MAFVADKAVELGINPALATCIVEHESQWQDRPGDNGDSQGTWQINHTWHPEVSDAVRHSLASSTEWSLRRIAEGHVSDWSTYSQPPYYCKPFPVFLK